MSEGWEPCPNFGDENPMRHCFCVSSEIQHAMMNHNDVECCWCGKAKCITYTRERVDGHGPGRTALKALEEAP